MVLEPCQSMRTNSPLRSMLYHPCNSILLIVAMGLAGLPAVAQEGSPRRTPPVATKPTNSPSSQNPSNGKSEPKWIWNSTDDPRSIPVGDSFFRRVMDLPELEKALIEVQADDACEVFVNGRRIGTTTTSRTIERFDVSTSMKSGKNLIAVRASNRSGNTAGLSIGFMFKPIGAKWRIVVSDEEWKGSKTAGQNWQTLRFDDAKWDAARLLNGKKPEDKPAPQTAANTDRKNNRVAVTVSDTKSRAEPKDGTERFTTQPGFEVEEVLSHKVVGSLVAMTFNEFGYIIAAQEGGPLLLIYDADKDGIPEKTKTYCDLVEHVQGILALNGDVYVTGVGPEGPGLYKLMDQDRNGTLEQSELLVKFKGIPGEHGPHQIAFGPDGCLYVVVGNHAQVDAPLDESSPYRFPYEGDLVQPRFEDPGGHAEGVKAPGGTVLRVDIASKRVQVVAGGLRNAYDLAFHPNGSLYVHDSDMEADIGAVWHRPTGIFKILESGEYGWRSGWANWPEYYLDRLPSIGSTGRGSPTGATVYNHFQYPTRYHRSLFLGDWSEGRILALNVEDKAKGKLEEFVVGRPMNVTDLEVGPDGCLYFCTGGRNTDGGIYRVKWIGEIPEAIKDLGTGITKAIRQPQIYSAFGRQAVAVLKKELGDEWNELIEGVAFSSENPARYRIQALDLMQMLGPIPTSDMLIELSNSSSEALRIKCAKMLGLHGDDPKVETQIKRLLGDSSSAVRIAAAETAIRLQLECDLQQLEPLLIGETREERFLGRRLLGNVDVDAWRNDLLASTNPRLAINAALALVTNNPSPPNAHAAIDSMLRTSKGYLSDADFVDLLRVVQVTLHLVPDTKNDHRAITAMVEREFPAGNGTINGELIRLATFLGTDLVPQAIEYLQTDTPMADRMLIGMHLPLMRHSWTSLERMTVLQFFETSLKVKSGGSYPLYVMRSTVAMSEHLTENEAMKILELGEQYPNAALTALMKVPDQLSQLQIEALTRLDSAIDKGGLEDDVFKRLKTGITAVLARQTNPLGNEYLRQRWRKSPDRRAVIALALADKPNEENWDYLVRSIGVMDLFAVPELCNAIRKIDVATEDPEAIRQTILQACRLVESEQNPAPVFSLLEYWTGEKPSADGESSPLAAWQKWYEIRFPDSPSAILPSELERPRWSLEFIEQYLTGDQGKEGSREEGGMVFQKAKCNACHKMNADGNGFGPDLTSVVKRFTRREFLESTLFPSHVISDQYASKKVLTTSGQVHTGILVKTPKGVAIRKNESTEVVVSSDEIEEILPSKTSAMPSGLLDKLTPAEIRDLLCFIGYLPQIKAAEEKPGVLRR